MSLVLYFSLSHSRQGSKNKKIKINKIKINKKNHEYNQGRRKDIITSNTSTQTYIHYSLFPSKIKMSDTPRDDVPEWTGVLVTLLGSTIGSLICIAIYEVARRNPILAEVFDRRRISKPHRTPPPLMRNAIFEWLFLSTEAKYAEYSDLAFMREVILERRLQRHPEKRKGFFGGWCCVHSDRTFDNEGVDSFKSPTNSRIMEDEEVR